MKQRGLAPILIILLLAAAIGGYFIYQRLINSGQVRCTLEARICSDGSSVGRIGSKCEFAPCPSAGSDETTNWKIYTNTAYKFNFAYPPSWSAIESTSPGKPYVLFVALGSANTIEGGGSVAVTIRNQSETDYVSLLKKEEYQIVQRSDIQLGENKATHYKLGKKLASGVKTQQDIVLTIQNGLLYEINSGANSNKDNQLVFDQILSTFKFTN